jgi:hypothetical protein
VEKRDSPAKREEAAEEESERPVKTVESDDAIAAESWPCCSPASVRLCVPAEQPSCLQNKQSRG